MQIDISTLIPGDSLGSSPWIEITQSRINDFARVTGDHQWIHVDPERCLRDSPFKQPVAHGFLVTSLLPSVFYNLLGEGESSHTILNYGIEKLRFTQVVKVNELIRFHISLLEKRSKEAGDLYCFNCEVEIKDNAKPAMLGHMLMLLIAP